MILPTSFVVRNESGMSFFEDLDISGSNHVFTKVWSKINSMTIKMTRTEESKYGKATVQTYEKKVENIQSQADQKFLITFEKKMFLPLKK